MNTLLHSDLNQFDDILESIKRQGLDYLNSLDSRPTSANSATFPDVVLPEKGLGTHGALSDFNQRLEPLIVASSGPRYWGFVTGGTTPAAIAGDWLATIYDQNTQATHGHGDISAAIELETIHLLRELFGLPPAFLGGFVTGATMSNFSCLAVARQWVGSRLGVDYAKEGINGKINVLAATPHSSALKSLALAGIGSNNIVKVSTLADREAIDIAALEAAIEALNGAPFILISSAGTVNTVDFDDFSAIARLKKQYDFWWHIDAAFGAFAVCSDTHRHLLKDWEFADSITVDCHKWLNVPYESAVFLVQQRHHHLQGETFQNSNAPYLDAQDFNYFNLLPENSRRLKALPAWFTLMAYGRDGYRDIVENSIAQASALGKFIDDNEHFELLAPVRLNTVCFTLRGHGNEGKVQPFLNALNRTGKVFMTQTVYKTRKGIRAAFVNWRTDDNDVKIATEAMLTALRQLIETA